MAQKKKKKRKLKVGNLLILIALVLVLIAGTGWLVYQHDLTAVQKDSETVSFEVASGQSAKTVTANLDKAGIIRNGTAALFYAKTSSLGSIKAGNYEIDKSWSTPKILEYLNDTKSAVVDAVSVTIVEGDWAKDIATKIAAVTNVSADDLMNLWNDADYLKGLEADYPFITDDMFQDGIRVKLEGYLAPNTYQFYRTTTADEVTRKILDQSLAVYDQYKDQIQASGYSIHQIYTLASIVQYESGKEEDMKMIAGVFYNRLKIDMALQSSVTVCYAIDVEKEGDSWKQCEAAENADLDSPYNTYKYPGLPIGPIENPGVAALDAVLNPTANDYYYFMADVYGDGTVYYAKTLDEQNANVQKYLK